MSPPLRLARSKTLVSAVLLLGFLEFTAAGLAVIFGFKEGKTPVLLGLSSGRIALAIVAFAVAAIFLAACVLILRRNVGIRDLTDMIPARLEGWLAVAGILALASGWIAVVAPASVFGELAAYYARLRPLLVAFGLLAAELWIAFAVSRKGGSFRQRFGVPHITDSRTFWAFLLCLLAPWLIMLVSKFGIAKIGPFWNPPGVPLSGLQGMAIVVLICLGVLISKVALQARASRSLQVLGRLLPIILYLSAVLIWGLTPMERHYFSLRPAPPADQPFPFSDARQLDLGALSIESGQGILFHGFTDKPLYMVFLAVLHLFAGDNYVILTWLQLSVLAVIPVALYMLGKQFHSEVLGVAVALMTILQQRNSILESRTIDSVNPRLLMTEVPTLMAAVVIAYLLFRWFRTRQPRYALASGAAIAAASLIRANPIFLLPVAGAVAVPILRARHVVIKHLLLFAAGFVMVFSPWLVTGVNESGVPWFWVKFQYVIGQRFQASSSPPLLADHPPRLLTPAVSLDTREETASVAPAPPMTSGPRTASIAFAAHTSPEVTSPRQGLGIDIPAVLTRGLSHALHNAAAALLSLPDLVGFNSVNQLAGMPPWGDTTWTGDLSLAQQLGAGLNLVTLALGLAWSWDRFRLAGFVPLLVFLGYDLGLSVATTSGGRYIVPVNWVAHFYAAVGWLAILDALAHTAADRNNKMHATDAASRKAVGAWIGGILCLALVIPFANVFLPRIVTPQIEETARAQLPAPGVDAGPGLRLVYGKVLYPEYNRRNRSVAFLVLTDHGYLPNLVVPRKKVYSYAALGSGSPCLVGLSEDTKAINARFLYVTPQE
jgi:hypothetical protein